MWTGIMENMLLFFQNTHSIFLLFAWNKRYKVVYSISLLLLSHCENVMKNGLRVWNLILLLILMSNIWRIRTHNQLLIQMNASSWITAIIVNFKGDAKVKLGHFGSIPYIFAKIEILKIYWMAPKNLKSNLNKINIFYQH